MDLSYKIKGLIILLILFSCNTGIHTNISGVEIGEPIDSLNGVKVYYNGNFHNVSGRSLTANGYNLGLKYQCVEFVKRYYYEHYHHVMPNTYGNAKDFFNKSLSDNQINIDRNLVQYKNGSVSSPEQGDLVVLDETLFNPYGHVAIISNVGKDYIEVIQQNCSNTRETYSFYKENNKYYIDADNLLGYLRKRI